MVKDRQKNFRLSSADALRIEEVKKMYGVTDAELALLGLQVVERTAMRPHVSDQLDNIYKPHSRETNRTLSLDDIYEDLETRKRKMKEARG